MPLRKGQWVKVGDQVAILVSFDQLTGECHVVNAKGETVLVTGWPLSELTPALYADIPESRRPDRDLAKALGYC